jgi:predicted 3-demethylubiquinone-9 3-methyltransferase (glyoxalase superfamily)
MELDKGRQVMQKIVPFLWFNNQAEEAMNFYLSVFKGGKAGNVQRMGKGGPMPEGTVISARFQLEGQDFYALNGGPMFTFTPAISLFVNCETQAEVDRLWANLIAGGGEEQPCGWLKDKFGVSWQIIPAVLGKLISDKNPKKAAAATQAMMTMKKIDIAALQKAHEAA